jgi:tRNA(Ile)-lysidine synthase
MAMLHLVVQQRPITSLVVLTVDHGLRDGSRAEAEQVARFCAALGVEHHILTWTGEKPRTGIQAKARAARYDLLAGWCLSHGIAALLTAHTMDDQAETVVMRKMRTDSMKSLAGIWPESRWNGIRVVRPLLRSRREELRGVLRQAGVTWSDDPANTNPLFERVRVRAALAEDDVARLAAVAEEARAQANTLAAVAAAWLRSQAVVETVGLLRLPRSLFAGLAAKAEMAEIICRAVHMAGGGRAEPSAIDSLLARILAGEVFRSTLGGVLVAVRNAEILIGREPARISAAPVAVGEKPLLWDSRFRISAPAGSTVVPAGPRCPKPEKALPAFVLAGLPAVTLPDGCAVLPHFQPHVGVSVGLGERFRL